MPAVAVRHAVVSLRSAAAIVVALGVGAMLVLSPRVPYADPWRFLATYLTRPFPANMVVADNGHCEALPNLVRLADLAWCDAGQWLQIDAGVALALAVLAATCRLWRNADAVARAAATLILCAGIFWLGNGRKLAHANESVSQFLVLAFAVAGITALRSLPGDGRCSRPWLAAGAAVAASFSFGAGLATFPAFAVLLLVQKATLRQWLPLAIAGALVIAGMRALGSGEAPPVPSLVEQVDLLLRWLGAPFVWMLSPLLDPAHAARLPVEVAREVAEPAASLAAASFGPALQARWPAFAFGAAGIVWLATTTWRASRQEVRGEERAALALAWFGASVGVLVVLVRLEYFRVHVDQLTTARYVPWSMLLWTGLLLATVLRQGCPAWRAVTAAFAFVLLLLPSQVWCGRAAWRLRAAAERTALGAAVGVLDRSYPLIETNWSDLARAVPLLREAGVAMFAWPETALLGTRPDAAAIATVTASDVIVRAVQNRFDGPGTAVQFRADDASGRVLLLDAGGTVRGLAQRMPFDGTWHGWLQGEIDAAGLRVAMRR